MGGGLLASDGEREGGRERRVGGRERREGE
jgi:hypothetical protein